MMKRRIVVPALVATAASGVAFALLRLRRGGDRSAAARERGAPEPQQEFRCECGQTFTVSGAGRHRVYWLADASPGDPVLSPACPSCERPLPRDPQAEEAPA